MHLVSHGVIKPPIKKGVLVRITRRLEKLVEHNYDIPKEQKVEAC